MTPKEALKAICEHCHKQIQAQPSKGDLPHKECPFRHISNDYCEEYDTIKEALEVLAKEKINQLKAKAFDIIMKSGVLFLSEDGDVYVDHYDFSASMIKGITEEEHSFLSLVMSDEYELAEEEE